MWRFSLGTPWYAVRSHRTLPAARSRHSTFHWCTERSSEAVPSPEIPALKVASGLPLTAVVRNTWSPQTTGLAWANPWTSVFHSTLMCCWASHWTGRFWPPATPDAVGPRNDSQSCAEAATTKANSAMRIEPPAGIHSIAVSPGLRQRLLGALLDEKPRQPDHAAALLGDLVHDNDLR